jgi:glycosyltransferase involved in cell wall biosynthesis
MSSLHVLMVHNYYLHAGGEDVAFHNEIELLRRNGHAVQTFEEHNARIADLNPISAAFGTIWSEKSRKRLTEILEVEKPDIVHFQNTFPLISPSAYYACHHAKAAVVQTLQNYRLLCPVATFYRDSHLCEDCLGKPITWPGILHACYRDSRSQTAVVTAMLAAHRALGTWHNMVDAYIALTEFSRAKFIEGGLPSRKIFLKPNGTSSDPGQKQVNGDFALFVGRLTEEKGIRTLLSAWRTLSIPLRIAGDGPLREELIRDLQTQNSQSIEYLGTLPHDEVLTLMKEARILIFPSEWYEGFPLTIAEALACALPIITSNIGSQAEIIRNGYSGLHFRVGEMADLREKIQWCFQNSKEVLRMGENARREYERKYTPERNYEMLIDVYQHALENYA